MNPLFTVHYIDDALGSFTALSLDRGGVEIWRARDDEDFDLSNLL